MIYIWILCTIPLTFKTSKYAMKEKDLMYFLENDEPCVNIGGICQQDTLSCPGGYQSGLCGGARNRRCCKGKFPFKIASLFFRMHRCRVRFTFFCYLISTTHKKFCMHSVRRSCVPIPT